MTTQIVTPFASGESYASARTKCINIADAFLGPNSTSGVTDWGDYHDIVNPIITNAGLTTITDGITGQQWLDRMNALNDVGFESDFANDLIFKRGLYKVNSTVTNGATFFVPSRFTRASSRYAQLSSGVWQEYGSNVPAIVPGVGLDAREGWQNVVPNPLFTGATVGVVGSGGSLGANWIQTSPATTGLTIEVISAITLRGLPGLRIRISGVSTGAFFQIETTTSLAASTAYTASLFTKIVSGSLPPLLTWASRETNGVSGTAIVDIATAAEVNAGLTEDFKSASATSNAATTTSIFRLGGSSANGTAVDVTFDIAMPQLTQTPYVMPPGVGTIPADVTVIPAADLGINLIPSAQPGPLVMSWRGTDFESAAGFGRLAEVRFNAVNRLLFNRNLSDGAVRVVFESSGTATLFLRTLAQVPRGTPFTVTATWEPDGDCRLTIGTTAAQTGTRAAIASALTDVGICNDAGGSSSLNCIPERWVCGFAPAGWTAADHDALHARMSL